MSKNPCTVFLQIVSAETILFFESVNCGKFKLRRKFHFFYLFKGGNYQCYGNSESAQPTPSRTLFIGGLKSRVLKLPFFT